MYYHEQKTDWLDIKVNDSVMLIYDFYEVQAGRRGVVVSVTDRYTSILFDGRKTGEVFSTDQVLTFFRFDNGKKYDTAGEIDTEPTRPIKTGRELREQHRKN